MWKKGEVVGLMLARLELGMRPHGDFNAEVAEVTEKRGEGSGTKGSSLGDGRVGNTTSMHNGSM